MNPNGIPPPLTLLHTLAGSFLGREFLIELVADGADEDSEPGAYAGAEIKRFPLPVAKGFGGEDRLRAPTPTFAVQRLKFKVLVRAMNVERSTFNAQHRTDGGRRTGGNGIASAGSEFPRRLAAKLAGRAAFCQARGVTIDRSAPVLVTGSAGRIGQAAVAALTAAGWRVRGFDRAPTPGAAESRRTRSRR